MKKLKFFKFVFAVLVPFILIMVYYGYWRDMAVIGIQAKIEGYIRTMYEPQVKDSNHKIVGTIITALFAYKFIFARWLKEYKAKLKIEEQRKSLFLLIVSLVKNVALWGSFYFLLSWLGVNSDKLFEAVGFLFASIGVGLIFEVLIWLKYLDE